MIVLDTFVPRGQVIPTDLRLKASNLNGHPDMQIIYERCPNEFAYKFTFYHTFYYQNNTVETCDEVLDHIIRLMTNQSYDHGASWRETNRERLSESDESHTVYKVNFYIRDAG